MRQQNGQLSNRAPSECTEAHSAVYDAALAASDKAGNHNALIAFMLPVLRESLASFVTKVKVAGVRVRSGDRLRIAAEHFGTGVFSRKDYLALHPTISHPTASRDLREGVEQRILRARGEKALTRYEFRR